MFLTQYTMQTIIIPHKPNVSPLTVRQICQAAKTKQTFAASRRWNDRFSLTPYPSKWVCQYPCPFPGRSISSRVQSRWRKAGARTPSPGCPFPKSPSSSPTVPPPDSLREWASWEPGCALNSRCPPKAGDRWASLCSSGRWTPTRTGRSSPCVSWCRSRTSGRWKSPWPAAWARAGSWTSWSPLREPFSPCFQHPRKTSRSTHSAPVVTGRILFHAFLTSFPGTMRAFKCVIYPQRYEGIQVDPRSLPVCGTTGIYTGMRDGRACLPAPGSAFVHPSFAAIAALMLSLSLFDQEWSTKTRFHRATEGACGNVKVAARSLCQQ